MADAPAPDGPPTSFGSRWGLPILFGGMAGFITMLTSMDKLIDQFGTVPGAAACIGLGTATGVVATLLCRLWGRFLFGSPRSGGR